MSNVFAPTPIVFGPQALQGFDPTKFQSPVLQQFLRGGAQLISSQEQMQRCAALCAMAACITSATACAFGNCNLAAGVC